MISGISSPALSFIMESAWQVQWFPGFLQLCTQFIEQKPHVDDIVNPLPPLPTLFLPLHPLLPAIFLPPPLTP